MEFGKVVVVGADKEHGEYVAILGVLDAGAVGAVAKLGKLRLQVRVAVHEIGHQSLSARVLVACDAEWDYEASASIFAGDHELGGGAAVVGEIRASAAHIVKVNIFAEVGIAPTVPAKAADELFASEGYEVGPCGVERLFDSPLCMVGIPLGAAHFFDVDVVAKAEELF